MYARFGRRRVKDGERKAGVKREKATQSGRRGLKRSFGREEVK